MTEIIHERQINSKIKYTPLPANMLEDMENIIEKLKKTMLQKTHSVVKLLHSWMKIQMLLMHQAYGILVYYRFYSNNKTH